MRFHGLVAAVAAALTACGSSAMRPNSSPPGDSVIVPTTAPSVAATTSAAVAESEPTTSSVGTETSGVGEIETSTTLAESPYPTVATVVLLRGSPLPAVEDFIPNLEPHCTRLYDIVTEIPLGDYVPYVAKSMAADWGSDEKIGCEIFFNPPFDPDASHWSSSFSVAWTDEAMPGQGRGLTDDADETQVVLSAGSVAWVDPTGDDEAGGPGDSRVVTMPRSDGSLIQVRGFTADLGGASLEVVITIADELDHVLSNVPG